MFMIVCLENSVRAICSRKPRCSIVGHKLDTPYYSYHNPVLTNSGPPIREVGSLERSKCLEYYNLPSNSIQ